MGAQTSAEVMVQTPSSWVHFRHLNCGINHSYQGLVIFSLTNKLYFGVKAIEITQKSRRGEKSLDKSKIILEKRKNGQAKKLHKKHTFTIIASHSRAIRNIRQNFQTYIFEPNLTFTLFLVHPTEILMHTFHNFSLLCNVIHVTCRRVFSCRDMFSCFEPLGNGGDWKRSQNMNKYWKHSSALFNC